MLGGDAVGRTCATNRRQRLNDILHMGGLAFAAKHPTRYALEQRTFCSLPRAQQFDDLESRTAGGISASLPLLLGGGAAPGDRTKELVADCLFIVIGEDR